MILVLNAGSSSLKFALFRRRRDAAPERAMHGQIAGLGATAALSLSTPDGAARRTIRAEDPAAALDVAFDALDEAGAPVSKLAGAGHRVVHGGAEFTEPTRIDGETLARIDAYSPLAPLHNPHNLACIRALAARAPKLAQVACFDTAFHADNPEVATAFALPAAIRERGVRRYGFHGLSYASIVRRWPAATGVVLPGRLLACHLGAGASLAAIRDGVGVATTMGFSPLDGLTMGTRCGSIDPGALLHLLRAGESAESLERRLTREAGLLGLSGKTADMRALEASRGKAARFALEHFAYWAVRHAGSMIAAMGGLDAVVFTGGIGENSARMRARIMGGLAWAGLAADVRANTSSGPRLDAEGSRVAAWILPADEEGEIAEATAALLRRR